MRFALPHPLPDARRSLTPPFHPYPFYNGRYIFCCTVCRTRALHCCSSRIRPVITRHFFRRSPDFASRICSFIRECPRGYIPSVLLTILCTALFRTGICAFNSEALTTDHRLHHRYRLLRFHHHRYRLLHRRFRRHRRPLLFLRFPRLRLRNRLQSHRRHRGLQGCP